MPDDVTLGEVSRKLDAFATDIRNSLSGLKADLREKADRTQFDRLEGRFDSLEARTEVLERENVVSTRLENEVDQLSNRKWKRWQVVLASMGGTLGVTATVLDVVLRLAGK